MIIERIHRYQELTSELRPQDSTMDGSTLRFETLEHGGDEPDRVPQAVRVTDAEGRSLIYVPITVDGRPIKSLGFETRSKPA